MSRLIIATNNAGKVREVKAILGDRFSPIVSLREMGLAIEVVEDGLTFADNAVKKAESVMRITGGQALADDSGLVVDALDGEPGVFSARYAGAHATDAANNEKLLAAMRDMPENVRSARFVSAVAYARPGWPTLTAYGQVEGRILLSPRGTNGFGYDPLFFLPEYGKSMAELEDEVKNGLSHRKNALEALLAQL